MNAVFHESLYRRPELMVKIRAFPVTVCGAGALGANIAENLARQGFVALRVIDRDRIEERNLSTQPYYRSEIGGWKARVLANALFRALGVEVEARAEELRAENPGKVLAGSGLVVDAFDNSVARQAVKDWCKETGTPCLHAGLADGYAEILWNESYRVPAPAQDDVCDYPLARNLVVLAVAVACEAIVSFVDTGAKRELMITLRDLTIDEM
jgi:molybdopterin/thiamine biosynthesis adenylyltransferase